MDKNKNSKRKTQRDFTPVFIILTLDLRTNEKQRQDQRRSCLA